MPSSPFVADMSLRVERHAGLYAREIDTLLEEKQAARRLTNETLLLDSFAGHVETVVATYDPPGSRRAGDSLVFRHVYDESFRTLAAGSAERARTTLLTALLAAEVEFRGPLRLSRTQNRQLAEVYERLGAPLIQAGLPAHAVLALRRAGGLYRLDEDNDAEDRCGLAVARARRLTQPQTWKRVLGLFPDLVCGYGYRPFRMLWFVALQLLVFSVGIALSSDQSAATVTYEVLMNYLNPLGLGDTENLRFTARPFFVAESYMGSVTMSVFFALLVRRWFRL